MKRILTIAGSDCSGGAGIQADIKTITAHKMYAMSVITALTAQNTVGVQGVFEVSPDFVARQLDSIFTDIFPDAVKIGMVLNKKIIDVIAFKLEQYNAQNIVVDTVMVSTSGRKLLDEEACDALVKKLFPAASIITPNIPEAEKLCDFKINTRNDMLKSAEIISKLTKGSVLIKGGHLTGSADDLFYKRAMEKWFESPKISNPNTHGTGCTLSSAIACNLALGYNEEQSIGRAKDYISGAIKAGLDLGEGNGPLNHMYNLI